MPSATNPPPGSALSLAATWFGSGLLPSMPGTWGSLAALPFAALIHWAFGGLGLLIASLAVTLLGVWVCDLYARRSGRSDPQEVVIDEVAGQWLTLAPLGLDPLSYLLGFAAFRFFDTLKPWPIRAAERLPGGWGIMADDIAAALAAGLAAYMVLTLTGVF